MTCKKKILQGISTISDHSKIGDRTAQKIIETKTSSLFDQMVMTTTLVSSIHALSISSVRTLETLVRSSPPITLLNSLKAMLSSLDNGTESVALRGGLSKDMEYAHVERVSFSRWSKIEGESESGSEQRSEKPSEARTRYLGSGFIVGGSDERESQKRFLAKFVTDLLVEIPLLGCDGVGRTVDAGDSSSRR